MRVVSRSRSPRALRGDEDGQPLPHERRDGHGLQLAAHAGPGAATLTPDDDRRARRREGPAQPGHRRAPCHVEDHVVAVDPVREVVAGVVEDVVGAERAHQVELGGAGRAGDLRTERLRELYGVRADATGRPGDQHRLTGPDPADVARLQCRRRGHRDHRGPLGREVRRHPGELALVGDGVLRERALPEAEDLVPHDPPGHLGTDARPRCPRRRGRGPGSSDGADRRRAGRGRAGRSSRATSPGRGRPRAPAAGPRPSPARAGRRGRRPARRRSRSAPARPRASWRWWLAGVGLVVAMAGSSSRLVLSTATLTYIVRKCYGPQAMSIQPLRQPANAARSAANGSCAPP